MKTKKTIMSIAIVILLSMLSLPAFSQVKFGIKADVGLSNPTFSTSAIKVENMTSYSVGPTVEAMFPTPGIRIGLEASLLYNDNRMTVSSLEEGTTFKQDVNNRYLRLPVTAKIKFGLLGLPLRIYGDAGPYLDYLIDGEKIDTQQIGNDIETKKFGAGATFGAGIEVLNFIQVGVNYNVQLTDDYAADTPNWGDPLNGKRNNWSLSAAVYF
ncbi:MAG: porin family protein [Dysgonamonadaceae bacterium]